MLVGVVRRVRRNERDMLRGCQEVSRRRGDVPRGRDVHVRRLAWVAIAAGVAGVAAAPRIALADETPVQRAERLFGEGKSALEAGHYAEACPKLAESQSLDPAAGTLLALGLCHEGEGKTATAWRELRQALEASQRAGRKDRADIWRRTTSIISRRSSPRSP